MCRSKGGSSILEWASDEAGGLLRVVSGRRNPAWSISWRMDLQNVRRGLGGFGFEAIPSEFSWDVVVE